MASDLDQKLKLFLREAFTEAEQALRDRDGLVDFNRLKDESGRRAFLEVFMRSWERKAKEMMELLSIEVPAADSATRKRIVAQRLDLVRITVNSTFAQYLSRYGPQINEGTWGHVSDEIRAAVKRLQQSQYGRLN